MESDSQESCSRQYGTRLFPGMGATGHLRKALANRPRVIRRFGGFRLALIERRRRDDQRAFVMCLAPIWMTRALRSGDRIQIARQLRDSESARDSLQEKVG